jgi:hypothetical protein
MQGGVFVSPHPHSELQAIQTRPSPHPFAVDRPALAPEQHPNPQIAKPGSGMGEIADAEPQGRLIVGLALSTPGRAPELSQATGPRTTHRETGWIPLDKFPTAGGSQTFFRSASESTCLSSERSTISRFNQLFSSSNSSSRRSSLTPRCAYLFFHAQNVCSAMPSCGQTSPMGVPDSACRRAKDDLLLRKLRPLHASAPFVGDRRSQEPTLF